MILLLLAVLVATLADLQNPGFETVVEGQTFPEGWTVGIGGGADATVELDSQVRHTGERSVRISNQSPMKAFVFASFAQTDITVEPETTYEAAFFAKGLGVKHCYLGIGFDGGGDRRLSLPSGDFDWRPIACQFTTPPRCSKIAIRFASDDVTQALWIDDVSLALSEKQWAKIEACREPRPFPGVFPRSKGPVARHLAVFVCTHESVEMERLVLALQGLVNRRAPRLYLINKTNPPLYDEDWLAYMKEKGYTGNEERVPTVKDLLARFRSEVAGAILVDPDLPGSVAAACMIAGIENALPATAELAAQLDLPVMMDFRGRWTRNVDAYRFVYDHYWPRMNHHVLAWMHPLSTHNSVRDYMTEFNVFSFWNSNYGDDDKGADPAAEEAFINEILAATPANIPVMGWPAYGDFQGIQEYEGVRWLSGFGKFVPGTEFCSNLSVHSAIRPPKNLFRQKCHGNVEPMKLDPDKIYVSLNILDSGDALWYWQLHQRKIWADPVRGAVPIGWCMNTTLYDALPLVLEWYYEHATPNDEFFAAVSGLGYMNTQVYANRFRPEDRDRIWDEYVHLTDAYCRKLDIDGIELYDGAWGEPTSPDGVLQRFVRGMKHLDYILADLGRHECVTPESADVMLDGTPVFHTLTRWQTWTAAAETARDDMSGANAWLLDEITSHAPAQRPGFMSAMAISWYYYPAWIKDLAAKLPPEYVVANPHRLAALRRDLR